MSIMHVSSAFGTVGKVLGGLGFIEEVTFTLLTVHLLHSYCCTCIKYLVSFPTQKGDGKAPYDIIGVNLSDPHIINLV